MKDRNKEELVRGDLIMFTIDTPVEHTAELVIYIQNHERVYDVEEDGEAKTVTTNTIQYYPLSKEGVEVATHDSGATTTKMHRQQKYEVTQMEPRHLLKFDDNTLRGQNKVYYDAIKALM